MLTDSADQGKAIENIASVNGVFRTPWDVVIYLGISSCKSTFTTIRRYT